ncbi:MAG: MFS transporter [Spirochaetales bacterium]|nr:MFS transporter [Spirochaetales bacterium]
MHTEPSGKTAIRVLAAVWPTQILSTLASGMSAFALSIWMYEQTRSAASMAFIHASYITPFLLVSVVAGPLIDRWNRKLTMAMSDATAALGTAAVMVAFALGQAAPWMLCVSAALSGIGNAFQWPAFSAVIGSLVPKKQLGRANGLMALIDAGPAVLAPILAGALLPVLGITGVLILDLATFVLAAACILVSPIPSPPVTAEGTALGKKSLLADAAVGFRYIFQRPSLLGLQVLFLGANLFAGMAQILVSPLILARNAMNPAALGTLRSATALGAFVGGLVMSAWGGPKKRVAGVASGWILYSVFGLVLFGLNLPLPAAIALSAMAMALGPVVNGSNQALWQSKVPPDLQGRVFSARRLIAWVTTPLSPLIAGFLADAVFEPAMAPGTVLGMALGPLFGTGAAGGMGVLTALCGLATLAVVGLAWSRRSVRRAEELVPDWSPAETSA